MPMSYNFVDYVIKRSQGLNRLEYQTINEEFGTRHMLTTNMFHEHPIPLNRVNKVNIKTSIFHSTLHQNVM